MNRFSYFFYPGYKDPLKDENTMLIFALQNAPRWIYTPVPTNNGFSQACLLVLLCFEQEATHLSPLFCGQWSVH